MCHCELMSRGAASSSTVERGGQLEKTEMQEWKNGNGNGNRNGNGKKNKLGVKFPPSRMPPSPLHAANVWPARLSMPLLW